MKIKYLRLYLYIFTFLTLFLSFGGILFIISNSFLKNYTIFNPFDFLSDFGLVLNYIALFSGLGIFYLEKNTKIVKFSFIISLLFSAFLTLAFSYLANELYNLNLQINQIKINQNNLETHTGIFKKHDDYNFNYSEFLIATPRDTRQHRSRSPDTRAYRIDIVHLDNSRIALSCSATMGVSTCIKNIQNHLKIENIYDVESVVKTKTIYYRGYMQNLIFDLRISKDKYLDVNFFANFYKMEIILSFIICIFSIFIYLFNVFFCLAYILIERSRRSDIYVRQK